MFVNQIPLAKAKAKGKESERESNKEGEKRIETEKIEKCGSSILMKMRVCVHSVFFLFTDIHICDTNDVQLCASDCIIVTSSAILRGEGRDNMWISSSNKSRDIILELLTDWCVLIVVIVCNAFRFSFFFSLHLSLSLFFFQFMRHLMCACVCMPYVNLLDIRVCLIYHQHHHHHHHVGCWCLPQLVFVVVDVVGIIHSFARSFVCFDAYHITMWSVKSMSRIER